MLRDAVILAGGKGERLKSVTGDTPKSLVPVGSNTVFLDWIISWLSEVGVQRVTLSLCYHADRFKPYLQECPFSLTVQCVVEPRPLGTGGAVQHVIDQVDLEVPFCVLNGDTYLRFDFAKMADAFQRGQCQAMIGLAYVHDTSRFGSVDFEEDMAVAFREKSASAGPGWVNNGCYVLVPEVLKGYTGKFSLERDVFPTLCRQHRLHVFQAVGDFLDIGLPEDYNKFVSLIANKD